MSCFVQKKNHIQEAGIRESLEKNIQNQVINQYYVIVDC